MKKYIWFMLVVSLVLASYIALKPKEVKIYFRYDDISSYSSDKIEKRVLDIFQKHHMPVTLGVIPYRCTGSPIDIRKQATIQLTQHKIQLFKPYINTKIVTIALHGYSHQSHKTAYWTEFKGMPYNEQYKKIKKGKTLLEKEFHTHITSFIPPFNAYDKNTIKILEKLGFTTLSAGAEGIQPYFSKLHFISNTFTIDKTKDAIQKAHNSLNLNPKIVIMFHEYNFQKQSTKKIKKSYLSLEKLDTLLEWIEKHDYLTVDSLK